MISVCIPAFNCAKTIESCLESVLSQNDGGIEIVIVNDGSRDGTQEKCASYAKKHGNVTLYSQDNRGQIAARQQCIRMARGDYSVFLDADDELCQGALELLNQHIEASHSDVYFFDWRYDSSTGQIVSPPFRREGAISKKEVVETFSRTGKINAMWSHAVKTSLLREALVSGFEDLRFGEDAVQSSVIFAKAATFYYFSTPFYIYRQNSFGVTHALDISKRYFDLEYVRQYLYVYYLRLADKEKILSVDEMSRLHNNLDAVYLENTINLIWQCYRHLSGDNIKWIRYLPKSSLFRSASRLSVCVRLPIRYLFLVVLVKLKVNNLLIHLYGLIGKGDAKCDAEGTCG
ncbi:glycosyltransferase family 2 protein [Collinsella sp. An271]|uniref:glycosyltransferase family 2 protein n=1 Tax=Collinsella sp. An271 TaxID=1965616 RepID=UPI001302195A|nr:glycosyltransferase family 2 protein [Collinsella sp. An271]